MTKNLKTYLAGTIILGSLAFTGYKSPKSMFNPKYDNLYAQEKEITQKISGLEKNLIQYHEAFIEANSIKNKENITKNAIDYIKAKKDLSTEKDKLNEIFKKEKPYKKGNSYLLIGLLGIISALSIWDSDSTF